MTIKSILLDLGGVLVDLEWHQRVSMLLDRDVPPNEIHQLWVDSPIVQDFECGRCDHETFVRGLQQEFEINATTGDIAEHFYHMVKGPKPDVEAVLGRLADRFQMGLLSNTNPVHHQRILDETQILKPFDQLFMSYQMGVMKPHEDIFHQALRQTGVAPEQTAFFDDGAINIEAAKKLGMQAFQVNSPQEIEKILSES